MNSVANLPLFAASVSTKRTTLFSNNKLQPIRSMRAVVQRVASASVEVSFSLFSPLYVFLNRRCETLHFAGRRPHSFGDRAGPPRARRPSWLRLRRRRRIHVIYSTHLLLPLLSILIPCSIETSYSSSYHKATSSFFSNWVSDAVRS